MNRTLSTASPMSWGVFAFALLLAIYFGALTLFSGWSATVSQFSAYWYFIVALAAGFGLQVALFVRLRRIVTGARDTGSMLAASGTTSTAAMVSCCAHYLVNIAPVLGISGLVSVATQYQTEFFWVGLAFNAAGIAFIASRLLQAQREHMKCALV